MNGFFGHSSSSTNLPSTNPPSTFSPASSTPALVSLHIFKGGENPVLLASSFNLSSFNYFTRTQIKPLISFNSRLVASRTPLGARQRVAMDNNVAYVYVHVHPNGLACTCGVSPSYPMRVAFGLLNEAARKFEDKYGGRWEGIIQDVKENEMFEQEATELMKLYQNPLEADKLLKVQKDLDEVRDIMLKNIDDLLKRGEKLDDLMEKSEHLSSMSVNFYRQAKKNNQCCQLY